MKLNVDKIILASGSPRRKKMLEDLGLDFKIVKPEVEESILKGELACEYVQRNSKLKLDNVYQRIKNEPFFLSYSSVLIISCDTVVSLDGTSSVLEKPTDEACALKMLRSLSGREHTVISGVSILYKTNSTKEIKTYTFKVETKVKIKKLSDEEILWYISTKEPMDKAGAYAMQGIGAYFIEEVHGSSTNVIGLPLCQLFECCKKLIEEN